MNYRRVKTEGGAYFFTVVTNERRKIFSNVENIKIRIYDIDWGASGDIKFGTKIGNE